MVLTLYLSDIFFRGNSVWSKIGFRAGFKTSDTTPTPTATPNPTETPEPTSTPEPTATPIPTETLEPTATPEPTAVPELTTAPGAGYKDGSYTGTGEGFNGQVTVTINVSGEILCQPDMMEKMMNLNFPMHGMAFIIRSWENSLPME